MIRITSHDGIIILPAQTLWGISTGEPPFACVHAADNDVPGGYQSYHGHPLVIECAGVACEETAVSFKEQRESRLENKGEFPDDGRIMVCPNCGSDAISFDAYDFGICPETGYHDAGERYFRCDCEDSGDVCDLVMAPRDPEPNVSEAPGWAEEENGDWVEAPEFLPRRSPQTWTSQMSLDLGEVA